MFPFLLVSSETPEQTPDSTPAATGHSDAPPPPTLQPLTILPAVTGHCDAPSPPTLPAPVLLLELRGCVLRVPLGRGSVECGSS